MMRWPKLSPSLGGVLQRTLAGGLSAMILFLSVLAASPSAHERLHADAGDANHACAITLFAHGVTSPVCHVEVPVPPELPEVMLRSARPELRLIAPRYLLKPLRGPPDHLS